MTEMTGVMQGAGRAPTLDVGGLVRARHEMRSQAPLRRAPYAAVTPLEHSGTVAADDQVFTVVIEPKGFFRDCVLSSLAGVTPVDSLLAFDTVADWSASPAVTTTELVILWQDDGSTEALAAIEKRILDIRAICPDAPLALMSQLQDVDFVQRVMNAGANAFIPTSLGFEATLRVFDLVRAGGTFIPASCLTHAARQQAPQAPGSAELAGLFSPKQLAVARALRKGMPNKLIAYELNMCESTVKVHVRTIMKKLKARNRTEVAFLTQSLGSHS